MTDFDRWFGRIAAVNLAAVLALGATLWLRV